ncbi:hypothetical protein GGF41_001499 [Coemansia sp. RSA 2531]|nr:hypothetical protein GGF41_001499 [Coemansia sp. RSA 2531]
MSNHLSPAQALPIDVLRSILKWVTLEKGSQLHGYSFQLENLKELLTVSSAWRQVALEFLWRQVNFTINDNKGEVQLKRPKWVKNNALPHNAANFVKEVIVNVSMSDIVGGVGHRLLNNYIGHTKLFPLANKLTLSIEECMGYHVDDKDLAIANALEFAKLLKSIAPASTTIKVIYEKEYLQTVNSNNNFGSSLEEEEVFIMITNVLYTGTKQAKLNLLNVDVKNPSVIDLLPLLSSLWIECEKFPDVGTSLVRKSASTLRHLTVCTCDANKLICDTNGEAIVYPNLQELHMYGCVRNSTHSKDMANKSILFPLLQAARLYDSYPFHNDVLFRGNTTTLEYLEVGLDYDTIITLNQEDAFGSKQRILRHVVISEDYGNISLSLVPEADMSRFLSNLVGAAKRLTVGEPNLLRACITAVHNGSGFQNIKVLNLRSYSQSLCVILDLLKLLPALVNLRSNICGLGPELEGITFEELPDYIASTYSDTGKNLQVWAITSFTIHGTTQIIDYILLLALACPKLRRIESKSNTTSDYHIQVAKALESGPYSKYATQLNRLLNVAL